MHTSIGHMGRKQHDAPRLARCCCPWVCCPPWPPAAGTAWGRAGRGPVQVGHGLVPYKSTTCAATCGDLMEGSLLCATGIVKRATHKDRQGQEKHPPHGTPGVGGVGAPRAASNCPRKPPASTPWATCRQEHISPCGTLEWGGAGAPRAASGAPRARAQHGPRRPPSSCARLLPVQWHGERWGLSAIVGAGSGHWSTLEVYYQYHCPHGAHHGGLVGSEPRACCGTSRQGYAASLLVLCLWLRPTSATCCTMCLCN